LIDSDILPATSTPELLLMYDTSLAATGQRIDVSAFRAVVLAAGAVFAVDAGIFILSPALST